MDDRAEQIRRQARINACLSSAFHYLKKRLAQKAIIVNREVQIRAKQGGKPGEETDIGIEDWRRISTPALTPWPGKKTKGKTAIGILGDD